MGPTEPCPYGLNIHFRGLTGLGGAIVFADLFDELIPDLCSTSATSDLDNCVACAEFRHHDAGPRGVLFVVLAATRPSNGARSVMLSMCFSRFL